jgi:RNA polymerase-interacting CarD/CdnL/TRCF family regulator
MKKQMNMAPNQTFAYLQHMLTELRILSEKEGAPVLAYLIEMAIIEANDLSDGIHVAVPAQKADSKGIRQLVGS